MNGNQDTHPHDLISALADGELGDGQRREVEAHLERCEACRELLGDIRVLRSAIATEEPPPVPERLVSQVGWRLRAASAGREGSSPRGRWRLAWPPLAVGSLAAAAILAFLFLRHDLPQEARIVGRGGAPGADEAGKIEGSVSGQVSKKDFVAEAAPPASPAPPEAVRGGTPTGDGRPARDKPATNLKGRAEGGGAGVFGGRNKDAPPSVAPTSAFAPAPAPAPASASAPSDDRSYPNPVKAGSADEGAARAPLAIAETSTTERSPGPELQPSPADEMISTGTAPRDAEALSNRAAAPAGETTPSPSGSPGAGEQGASSTRALPVPTQTPPGSQFLGKAAQTSNVPSPQKKEARGQAGAPPGFAAGARTVLIFKDPVVLKCADVKDAGEQLRRLVERLGGRLVEGHDLRTIMVPIGRLDEMMVSIRKIGELRAPGQTQIDPASADYVTLRVRIEP